jgi:CheY-like chemotaxis protein
MKKHYREDGDNGRTFIELSAQLVHDVSTPIAIAKVNNEFIADHLSTLLAAYEAQLDDPEQSVIPLEHLQAIRKAPALIKEQCERVEQKIKAHWQAVSKQANVNRASISQTQESSGNLKLLNTALQVLLVEDEPIHQAIALKLLSPTHEVDIASSGQEAIKKCQDKPYDLVLMDICLPDMDGRHATKLIRRAHASDLAIIALSNMPVSDDELRQTGFDGQLGKPLNQDAFRQYLQAPRADRPGESAR